MEGCRFIYNHGAILVQAQIEGVWQSSNIKYNSEDQTKVTITTSFWCGWMVESANGGML